MQSNKLYVEKLSLLGIAFLLIFFCLGMHVGWLLQPYDELRIFQIIMTLIFFIIAIRKTKDIQLFFPLFFLVTGSFFILSGKNIYIIQDIFILIFFPIWLYILCFIYKELFFKETLFCYSVFFILILTSVVPSLFLLFSIKKFIIEGAWYDWQMNYDSIRVYDSFIVPIIFLAIYLKSINYKYISYTYPFIVFLLTLGLWFDGARAALLSVLMGLVVIFIFSTQHRKLVLGTAVVILSYFAVYHLTYYFYSQIHDVDTSLNVIRTSSSGRWELWNYAYQKWIEQPWKGMGGNFLAQTDYPLNHLHNFYLKLIFEWGVLGFIFLCWIFYQLKKVLTSNDVHIALKAGICAIAVDAFFSGNLVYPASQISIVLLLGLAFSQYKPDLQAARQNKYLSKFVILLWFGLFMYILGNYFLQDLLCWRCGSHAELMAPGFWYYGKAEHLIHHSLIP